MTQISIVIPCRNEAPFIEECIHAIYQSDVSTHVIIDVFVTDGMSNDGTREKIMSLQEKYASLHLVDNKKQLTPFAFNLGIHAADFDFLQIIGARHIISPNYLSKSLEILSNDKSIWCVGGRLKNEFVNETGKIVAEAMSTTFGMGLGNFRTLDKSGFTDTVTSPMYPKFVFENIGYFDEDLVRNQDDDFNYRVTSAGGKIYFCSEISLKYYVRGSYSGLWKQFFQYGYWKVFVNRKHKAVTTFRQLIPPLFVLYLALHPIVFIFSTKFGILTSVPLLLYCILAVLFTYKVISKNPKLPYLKVLQTYVILHVSYGMGYLLGILDFLILRKKPSEKQKELSR